MIAEHVLSYTGRAQPLFADDVLRDITEFQLDFRPPPDKILVWEHQWDFLVKKNKPLGPQPEYIFDRVEFDSKGDLRAYGKRLPKVIETGTLWGIPVEVLEA